MNTHYGERTFSYFPSNIKITKPLGELSLLQMLNAIKQPKDDMIALFSEIEKASVAGDLKRKAELKQKLYYFVPNVKLDGQGRSYSNITGFNNLMILDFDNLEKDHALAFQKYLFDTYPFIISTMISSSRKGVKAVVLTDGVSSIEDFKSVFYALAAEMEQYEGFDGTGQNCVLSFYFCYSPELLYREDAIPFTKRGGKINEMQIFEGEFEPLEDVEEQDREIIRQRLRTAFDKITDTGHFVVRSNSLAAGGFCGAGYFELDEMRDFLYDLIESTPYLQKSLTTYKKTCDDMLSRGYKAPVWLDKHKPQ